MHKGEFGASSSSGRWTRRHEGGDRHSGGLETETTAHPDRKYRILVFEGCRTGDYEKRCARPRASRPTQTDLIQTSRSVGFGAETEALMAFLDGLVGQQSAEEVVKGMNKEMKGNEQGLHRRALRGQRLRRQPVAMSAADLLAHPGDWPRAASELAAAGDPSVLPDLVAAYDQPVEASRGEAFLDAMGGARRRQRGAAAGGVVRRGRAPRGSPADAAPARARARRGPRAARGGRRRRGRGGGPQGAARAAADAGVAGGGGAARGERRRGPAAAAESWQAEG